MPLRYANSFGDIHIAVWEVQETEEELWRSAFFSTGDVSYLATIRHPRRRLESLGARAALQTLPTAPFRSLSHSYPWAAAATAPHPIAIDIERHRLFPTHVEAYFTQESEKEQLIDAKKTIWHIWCAKEVAYKLLCQEFEGVSFRRELDLDGEEVVFRRGPVRRSIGLRFIQTGDWLLVIGEFV